MKGGQQIRARHGGMREAIKKSYPEVEFKKWRYGMNSILCVC